MTRRESSTEESPLKFELLQSDDYSKYLLYSKTEILFLLRALLDKGALITVYFNKGSDFLLSSILWVAQDGSHVVLDCGSSEEMNRLALQSDKLICVTSHEKVKIQFVVRRLEPVLYQERPAFRAPVPENVLRLQRREYYRLTTSVVRPLKCFIPVPQPDGGSTIVEANVVDISGGGVGMIASSHSIEFEVDSVFENCRLELPDSGTLNARLRVRSVFQITSRNGSSARRYGCQFVDLPGSAVNAIQRYIIKVERERKARESGML